MYHKELLAMIKSLYNSRLFFRSESLWIVTMQTNNTLILANNNLAIINEKAIKLTNIIIIYRKYFTFLYIIKFNGVQIKLDSNGIILTKKSYIRAIFLAINYATDFTNLKKITKKRYYPKNST